MSPSVHLQGSSITYKARLIEPQNPAKVPLPPQDQTEIYALIPLEWWQNTFNNLPPEIWLAILSSVLLELKTDAVLDLAVDKGAVAREAWPALYRACSLPIELEYKKISESDKIKRLQSFFRDAQKYGGKTLQQIVYGLNLRKKPLNTITIEDFKRAGIISREPFLSNDIPRSKETQNRFWNWLCEKPERILACLR
jgi:hypothetical protein